MVFYCNQPLLGHTGNSIGNPSSRDVFSPQNGKHVMVGQQLDKEKKEVLEKIKQKKEDCFGIITDRGFEITCCKSWVAE